MKSPMLFLAVLSVLLAGTLMSVAPAPKEVIRTPQSFFDKLSTAPVARFELTFDIDQLESMKKQDAYFPATFSLNGDNWDAKIKVRGRYRRRVCDFPPLKIKMSKEMLAAAGLQSHNKFKLVTHCSDDFDGRDNVLREQLAYDLYHLITGEGYRTQLVEVSYRNVKTGESTQRFGILIQDTDEMAQSMNATECDNCLNTPAANFANGSLDQLSMFEYMIGNADWNLKMARNIKVVQNSNNGQFHAVPYDFDFAGMVNTEYAIPNPDFAQVSVKDRIWMSDSSTPAGLQLMVDQFLAKEMEVMSYVNHNDLLSNKSRREVSNYLSDFFKELKDGSFMAAHGGTGF